MIFMIVQRTYKHLADDGRTVEWEINLGEPKARPMPEADFAYCLEHYPDEFVYVGF